MTWFKVDDGFYDHPKFLSVPNAAVGLWVKVGAWCGKHLTDGVIPASQVKMLKGTPSQIRALIDAGLWVRTELNSGAKAYQLHDWNEYQPSREEKLKERADSAERQRKSRDRKRQEQEQRENVTRDSHVTGSCDSRVLSQDVSQRPDPTRPDPSLLVGNERGEGYVSRRDDFPPPDFSDDELGAAIAAEFAPEEDGSGVPSDWSTPEDPRCRKHADLPRDQVPPCYACASARTWFEVQDRDSKQQRRAAIDECDWCDHNGFVQFGQGRDAHLAKCDHQHYPEDPRPQTGFKPTSDPKKRAQLLKRKPDPF